MPTTTKAARKPGPAAPASKADIQRSKRIVAWLKTHPLISKHGLCKAAGYSSASLNRVMSGNEQYPHIPAVYLDGLEKELREYGYAP